MYKPYRASLKAIWRELSRASRKYPPLFHHRFSDALLVGPDVISEEAFLAFQKAYPQRTADEWVSWQRTPDGSYWGRFHGSQNGLDEFERLAESAYLVLQEFDAELPEGHGVHGWLNVIHDMARDSPTPLLRTRYGVWGVEPQPEGQKFDELVSQFAKSDETGIAYRPHPLFNLLVHNVFTSSMSAIEMILDPGKALLVGDVYLGDFPVDFPLTLSDSDDESSPEPDQDLVAQLLETSSPQELLNQINAEGTIAPPVVEMTFDGATWTCRYEFMGIKEAKPFTTNLNGFKLYRAILARDRATMKRNDLHQKSWTSTDFWREAGLHRASVSYTSNGTVDGDSDDRHAILDAEDEGGRVSILNASWNAAIDADGLSKSEKIIKELNLEFEKSANPVRRAEIRQQIKQIEVFRAKDLNKREKSRPLVSSEEEKARKRITNRLKDARNILGKSMPSFVHYLVTTVTNDGGWSYDSRRASALFTKPKMPSP